MTEANFGEYTKFELQTELRKLSNTQLTDLEKRLADIGRAMIEVVEKEYGKPIMELYLEHIDRNPMLALKLPRAWTGGVGIADLFNREPRPDEIIALWPKIRKWHKEALAKQEH